MRDGKLRPRQGQARRSHRTRSGSRQLNENQRYWTERWANQMNYRYWKERCQAEMTQKGVQARQLFYEGTMAYKTGDFPKAADEVQGRARDLEGAS